MRRRVQDSVETVNAAAIVLAAAARSSRVQQLEEQHHVSVTKKRWWSRLTANLCFWPNGYARRITDASPASEPAAHDAPTSTHHLQQPALPFAAPPSSPASSPLNSEVASPQAPPLFCASSYSSPTAGPPSIFAIGPYAREPQQPVSPPVFSTCTTAPSTAPLTPPPESTSFRLATTNPSSPEVPFARLFASSSTAAAEQHSGNEGFHAYQLHPGSPICGQLVSPGSVCSTSSSPPAFRTAEQLPKILGPEEIASWKLHRRQARNDGSLLDGHIVAAVPEPSGGKASRCVSFEMADEANEGGGGSATLPVDETYHDLPKSKEFVFGGAAAALASSPSMEVESRRNWPFFPMVEHGMHAS